MNMRQQRTDDSLPSMSRSIARAGFTLTEMMVASMIFLIASVSFSHGLIGAMKTSYMATDYYLANCIARNRIQRAKTLAFDSMDLLGETMIRVNEYGETSTTGFFYRTTAITNKATNCIEIIVSVHFTEPGGKTSAAPVTLQTMIAEGM